MIQTVLDRAVERLFLSTALFVQLIILTGCVNMDFLRQGFESYRLTDRQTDRQDRNYIPFMPLDGGQHWTIINCFNLHCTGYKTYGIVVLMCIFVDDICHAFAGSSDVVAVTSLRVL